KKGELKKEEKEEKKELNKEEKKKELKKEELNKEEPSKRPPDARAPGEPRERRFLFTYSGTVKDLKPGQPADVWLPMPQDSPFQKAEVEKQELPVLPDIGKESQYGNAILHFQANADGKGEIPFKLVF